MRLYRPVVIESTAQAAALPVGTIALLDPDQPSRFRNHVAVKVAAGDSSHQVPWRIGASEVGWDESLIGWTALVPVEAKEERMPSPSMINELLEQADYARRHSAFPLSKLQARAVRRFVTPWEDAS